MTKKLLLVVMTLFLASSHGNAKEVAGVDMPDTLTVGQDKLLLNGAGLRKRNLYLFDLDIYVGGLYLKNKSGDAMKIIYADETMAVRIHYVRVMRPMDSRDAMYFGFRESCKTLGINQNIIENDIRLFLTFFMNGTGKNDVFDITYSKTRGVQVFKNKAMAPLVTIKNFTLKKALFGIWLAARTEDNLNVLRNAMLDCPRTVQRSIDSYLLK